MTATNTTTPALLYHDPTSEPSRAVHWFAVEASIPLQLRYTWLTRHEHRNSELLAVNPRHQVPALRDGDFCLSEATAIIRYLAEIQQKADRWLGGSLRERARINQLLSWYHTNLRQQSTLEYFLLVLLLPVYKGVAPPPEERADNMRKSVRKMLERTQEFLGAAPFLGGERVTVPDLLYGAEIFALDCDPNRQSYFEGLGRLQQWLDRLRQLESYEVTHKAWNSVVPLIEQHLLCVDVMPDSDAEWVAQTCERTLGLESPRRHD